MSLKTVTTATLIAATPRTIGTDRPECPRRPCTREKKPTYDFHKHTVSSWDLRRIGRIRCRHFSAPAEEYSVCTHAPMCTHMHSAHTMPACIRVHTHPPQLQPSILCEYTCTPVCALTCTHFSASAEEAYSVRTHSHVHARAHAHMCMPTCAHMCTHADTHAHMCTHMHAHVSLTCRHTCAHTCTHTGQGTLPGGEE